MGQRVAATAFCLWGGAALMHGAFTAGGGLAFVMLGMSLLAFLLAASLVLED